MGAVVLKKGIKKGALVTAGAWYFPRRVYGRVTCYLGRGRWGVLGSFGLGEFLSCQLRPAGRRGAEE